MRKHFERKAANGKGADGWVSFYKRVLRRPPATMTDYKKALEYVEAYVPDWQKNIEALPPYTKVARLHDLMETPATRKAGMVRDDAIRETVHRMLFEGHCSDGSQWQDELASAKLANEHKTAALSSSVANVAPRHARKGKASARGKASKGVAVPVKTTPARGYAAPEGARLLRIPEGLDIMGAADLIAAVRRPGEALIVEFPA